MKLFTYPLAFAVALCVSAPISKAHEKDGKPEPAHHAAGAATIKAEMLPNEFYAAGNSVPAEIRLTGADGKPVTLDQLEVAHTKQIHLLIIDESLSDYQHAHPDATETPGVYRFNFKPRFGGNYHVWADLHPKATDRQEYSMTTVAVKGEPALLKETVNTTADVAGAVAGYRFVLTTEGNEPLQAGKAVLVKIKVLTADGREFTGLEPLMGAFAHMVGFTGALDSVTHVHPLGKEPETDADRGGPEMSFHVVPEKPGYLKLFLQTQIHGVNEFAAFGFNVAAPVADIEEPAPVAASTLTPAQKTFMEHYEAVRSALAADDLKAAQAAAVALSKENAEVGGVKALLKSDSLKQAREAFKLVSAEAMKLAAKQPGYYVIACPMVAGGNWVQTTKRIANPYLGAAMLGCGAIKN
ncbi:MAG: hypothetical protein ABJF10_30210 [Chthoniobacter sp.]|uniref:hypothetical protein n=1 Tax=Chthoniobacter sp. TaxID=2510640 RepID=UPI0032A650AF